MKKAAQFVARTLDASGALRALEHLDDGKRLRVLVYHRVDEPSAEPDLDPGLISATPEEFREQMLLLARRYNCVSLSTVLAAQRGEADLPPGAVLITFDDGYLDFAANAWPIMRELGLPAVLFVPTAFPDQEHGTGFWWDRLYSGLSRATDRIVRLPDLGDFEIADHAGRKTALKACKQHVKSLHHGEAMDWVESALGSVADVPSIDRVLSWEELRQLASEGLDVCPHGHIHALCTRLTTDELKEDLATSQSIMRSEMGEDVCTSVIAWPANACSNEVCNIARDLGFEMGFGGIRGVTPVPASDALDVMRVPVLRYQRELFRAQLRPAIAGLGRYVIDKPWKGR